MNLNRSLSLITCTLLLAACAGKSTKPTPPSDTSTAAPSTLPATNAAATAAEDDYAALYGEQSAGADAGATGSGGPAYDPWERYNRGMHRFNVAVDRAIAKPVATGYSKVVPSPMRQGVSNFFSNLGSPVTMVNHLLQGRPGDAWDTFGRFLMNTTLGIGGLFDPASKALIANNKEDFGQTLATWGWRNSRYFELPFFGPRTLRDTFSMAGDYPLSPLRQIENDKVRIGLQGLQLVDTRARLLGLEDMRAEAPDEYALVRDAWMQRRNYQIQRDLRSHQEDAQLPDYLRDDKDNTVPVDAMPMPTLSN